MLELFGFSWIGFVYLLLLFVPNLLWTKVQPVGYLSIVSNENKALLALERIGQVAVSSVVVFLNPVKVFSTSQSNWWLVFSLLFMLLYEIGWIRYFRSQHLLRDFYGSMFGIPVPLATLPVFAFLFLGIYGKNPLLIFSVTILGIGHIGIHLQHLRDYKKTQQPNMIV